MLPLLPLMFVSSVILFCRDSVETALEEDAPGLLQVSYSWSYAVNVKLEFISSLKEMLFCRY